MLEPAQILSALIGSSPISGLLFFLWWTERKRVEGLEKKVSDLQNQRVEDAQSTAKSLANTADDSNKTIMSLGEVFKSLSGGK